MESNFKTHKIRSKKHLEFVRSLSCIINDRGQHCNGVPVVAHHLTHVNDKGGMGLKTGDDYTLPLCWLHHQTLHSIGERKFWKQWGIEAEEEAAKVWKIAP